MEFLHESPQSASLAKWVKRHFDNGHTSVSAETVSYLIGQVGADMSTLLFEIEKLCAYASAEKKEAVTKEDVDFVCIKNTDARIEDISRAVLDGVYSDAVRALAVLLREKVAELYIFGAVTNKISELSAVDYYKSQGLYKTDIAAKTGIRDFVVGYHLQSLASLARTRAPGVLGRMIGILDEYDVKFKSSPCDKTILLQDLLLKLCLA